MNRILLAALTLAAVTQFSCIEVNWNDDDHPHEVRLGPSEVHEGWYFAAGDHVEIAGTVNGDCYVAAKSVMVSGTINGDLIAAGKSVEITGAVTEHVRAAAQYVRINGSVGKDITAAGQSVETGAHAVIAGGVIAAGKDVELDGTIMKSAKIAATTGIVRGTIGGDLNFSGNDLTLERARAVGGSLTAHVERRSDVSMGDSAVAGEVTITLEPRKEHEEHWSHAVRGWFHMYMFFSLLIAGTVFLLVAPTSFGNTGAMLTKRPGKSFVWSLFILVFIPVIAVILMITVFGIPLGVLLLMLYAALLYLSQLTVGIAVGRRILGMEGKRGFHLWLAFVVGLVIVSIVEMIPLVRPIMMLVGLFVGTGALVLGVKQAFAKSSS